MFKGLCQAFGLSLFIFRWFRVRFVMKEYSKHQHGGDVYRYRGCVDFSSNCNPLGTPQGVIQAAAQSAAQMAAYPDIRCQELRDALAAYEGVSPSMLHFGNGAAEVIFSLCWALKPAKALLPAPTFAEYGQALSSVGCQIVHVYLKEENGFRLDGDFIQAVERERPQVAFLCNPNNPTGVLTPADDLAEVLAACEQVGCLLVLDECFNDFIRDREAYTMKGYLAGHLSLFLLKAFTKRYAMAGIRLGYGLSADEGLLARMGQVTQPWNVSSLAQAAGVAALKEEAYVEQGRQLIFQEQGYLRAELARLGYRLYDSRANYLFFYSSTPLWEACKDRGVLIRDCSNYPGLGQGYYRVAVRTHEENRKLIQVLGTVSG